MFETSDDSQHHVLIVHSCPLHTTYMWPIGPTSLASRSFSSRQNIFFLVTLPEPLSPGTSIEMKGCLHMYCFSFPCVLKNVWAPSVFRLWCPLRRLLTFLHNSRLIKLVSTLGFAPVIWSAWRIWLSPASWLFTTTFMWPDKVLPTDADSKSSTCPSLLEVPDSCSKSPRYWWCSPSKLVLFTVYAWVFTKMWF